MQACVGLLKRARTASLTMQLCGHTTAFGGSSAALHRPFFGPSAPRVFTASAPVRAQAAAAPAVAETPDKRPPSAYNLFVKAKLPALKASDPSVRLADMGKHWKAASPSERSGFEDSAAQAKAAYDQAHPKAEKPAKAPKAPRVPKEKAGPVNAYGLFMKEQYPALQAKLPGAKLTEITKEVSALWKTADKQSYTARAAEAKAHWLKEHPPAEKPVKEKAPRAKRAPSTKPPSTKAPSAYQAFVKANASDEARVESDESVFTRLGRRWRGLPEAEKAKWAPQAQ